MLVAKSCMRWPKKAAASTYTMTVIKWGVFSSRKRSVRETSMGYGTSRGGCEGFNFIACAVR